MKKFKKSWLYAGAFIAIACFLPVKTLIAIPTFSDFSNFWAIKGIGSLTNTAIAYIDSTRDFNLYDGDINQGVSGTRPSTTAGAYPGLTVPIYNGYSAAMAEGDVIIASVTATTSGYGSEGALTATTTVLGVAAEAIAVGAIGSMRVGGYAIVKTTGAVAIGDLLVSSAGVAGVGAVGYAGKLAPGTSDLIGCVLGKAMSVGTAAGGNTLILLSDK